VYRAWLKRDERRSSLKLVTNSIRSHAVPLPHEEKSLALKPIVLDVYTKEASRKGSLVPDNRHVFAHAVTPRAQTQSWTSKYR